MKKTMLVILLASLFLINLNSFAQSNGRTWLSASDPTNDALSQHDPTKPVKRGYIVVHSEPAVNGAKVTVEQFQDRLNSAVKLSLYTMVNDGRKAFAIPLKFLTAGVPDPNTYIQTLEFFIDYKELQDLFSKNAPNAIGLQIGEGTPMAVKADFPSKHNYGSFDRGGVFFLPPSLNQQGRIFHKALSPQHSSIPGGVLTMRATALDVAYPIVRELLNMFNDRATGAGLKLNGQIRSRLEGEGKYQVLTEQELIQVKKKLFDLTNDASEQARLFGPGWTLKLEDRYMQRDPITQQLILDSHGLPIPDPMVDNYMDNDRYDAASNDMAIRHRWTEGNQTGSWNFKRGYGRMDPVTGIVYRIEDGFDTTDDKPETIAKFVDSMHPLNSIRVIRDIVPGAKPSDFLKPSAKLTDTRHKFKLVNAQNLAIEISTDAVLATNLRDSKRPPVRFFQIEMDIDHLSTASQNVARVTGESVDYALGTYKPGGGGNPWRYYRWPDDSTNEQQMESDRAAFLAKLDDKAFFDGRPVLHTAEDLEANSPLLQSRKSDFDEAARVIAVLRDHTLGSSWRPGAQKYAYAAALLGLVSDERLSPSVKKIKDMFEAQKASVGSAGQCSVVFTRP